MHLSLINIWSLLCVQLNKHKYKLAIQGIRNLSVKSDQTLSFSHPSFSTFKRLYNYLDLCIYLGFTRVMMENSREMLSASRVKSVFANLVRRAIRDLKCEGYATIVKKYFRLQKK